MNSYEECARIADELRGEAPDVPDNGGTRDGWEMACRKIAEIIRAIPPTRPDLLPFVLDATLDPGDYSIHHPSLQYVLIRGFSAMGWEQPIAASEDMAMEILKTVNPMLLPLPPPLPTRGKGDEP